MDMMDFELNRMMPNVDAYCFPVNPEPWAIGEISVVRNKKTGKNIPVVSPNANLATYQDAVRSELAALGAAMKLPSYSIRFHFCRVMASYKSASGRTLHRNQADVTNMQKATEDALQGVIIGNDRDVLRVESVRVEPEEGQVQGWVMIELLYGLGPDLRTPQRFGDGISDQAQAAYIRMTNRLEDELRVQDNEWNPGDD